MKSDLVNDVSAMVAKFTGVRQQELTLETTLFGDLGIDGEDAVDFFREFAKSFNVDITNLNLNKHFGPEASGSPMSIFSWAQGWWSGDFHSASSVVSVSIRDLVKAAQVGKWV